MTDRAYAFVVLCGLLLAAHITRRIQAGRLRVVYALSWGTVGVAALGIALWRGSIDRIADLLGIDFGPSVLLLFGGLFGVVYLLHLSEEVSGLRAVTRRLTQEIALMQANLPPEKTTVLTPGHGSSARPARRQRASRFAAPRRHAAPRRLDAESARED
ncbi:MAG: DUF2304 domain-containing protein [Myxococcales bacterium]|nr:DUF2304 domain-containing protein [Myxococcales bacterium]MCB9647415.1 DUF2304 domain-containing protein [Deltaproteobacteria bacterium]